MINKNIFNYIDQEVPRYTSYPTAPNFSQKLKESDYLNYLNLSFKQSNLVSLYVHVPFCKKLCLFCGCNTLITDHYKPVEDYLGLILKEIEMLKNRVNQKPKLVHLHFGGGSPTILSSIDFTKLMSAIREFAEFSDDIEIAIEIDPRNFDEEKAKIYSALGINRASIGVQDLNLDVQKAINRVQPLDIVKKTFDILMKNDINKINVDLIYGLPLQTVDYVRNTAMQIINLKPSRIAFFAYAHVTWKKKQQVMLEKFSFASALERLQMYITAKEIFEADGYVAIGMDHFAKKNDSMSEAYKNKNLKRNFQGYSSDIGEKMLGIGMSSIGFIEQIYVQNSSNLPDYRRFLEQEELPLSRSVILNQEDKFRKEIIDSIMCYMEVDLDKIISKYNLEDNYFDKELSSLKIFENDGLVKVDNKKIFITTDYRMIARNVSSIFDKYFSTSLQKYSKVS